VSQNQITQGRTPRSRAKGVRSSATSATTSEGWGKGFSPCGLADAEQERGTREWHAGRTGVRLGR